VDEIFERWNVQPKMRDKVVKAVDERVRAKGKEFFRALMSIQREFPLDNKFYVELLDFLGTKLERKAKGTMKGTRKSSKKVLASAESMSITRNADGGLTVTIIIPPDALKELDKAEEPTVPVEDPAPVAQTPEPAVKARGKSVADVLRPKYIAAISGTDISAKDFWQLVLYHSLDKGRVTIASISAKTGQPPEVVRTYLQNRYNNEVVNIVFYDGGDSVTVTWKGTNT
jgi:hypothetical protein